jgi:hypothetical protein
MNKGSLSPCQFRLQLLFQCDDDGNIVVDVDVNVDSDPDALYMDDDQISSVHINSKLHSNLDATAATLESSKQRQQCWETIQQYPNINWNRSQLNNNKP